MSRGSQSLLSQGLQSNGRSNKKIGGLARRIHAKNSTRMILDQKKFDKMSGVDSEDKLGFNSISPNREIES